MMKNKCIGIDLTAPTAHIECGMVRAFKSIFEILPTESENIHFVLFCTPKNIGMYEYLQNNIIEVLTKDINEYHENIHLLDVLHSPFNDIHTKIKGVLSLLTKYDLTPTHFVNNFRKDQIENSVKSCYGAEYILTSSKYSKHDISMQTNISKSKIKVIYLPVEMSNRGKKKPHIDLSKPYLCYPAAGRAHKNHENLFKAFSKIESNVNLVLTTGESRNNNKFDLLEKLADKYNVRNKVYILGCLSDEELNFIYANTEALVYPSLSEGFGLPLMEAMSFYRPILCSYWSCIPEIVGDVGIYFNPNNPDNITQVIDNFMKSTHLIDKILYDKQLAKFKKNKIAEEMIAYYGELAHKSKILNIRKKRDQSIKGRLTSKNIMVAKELFDDELLSYTKDFVLLMDCSRILGSNNISGISKYILKLYDVLSLELGSRFVPFFDEKARGLARNESKTTRFILNNGKEYSLYHKGYAENLAGCISNDVVYFSPYHPLPKVRDSRFSYALTIFDIFHLTRLDLYPEKKKYFTYDIVNSIITSDEVICISHDTANALVKYKRYDYNISVTFLPSMNDMIEKKVYSKKNMPQVLIPFQNDPRKNFSLMLESYYQYLKIGGRESKLCIFGKTNLLSDQDKTLISEIKRYVDVSLVLMPSDLELANLMYASSCFLYLSELEGFGLPPLEAMVSGCPPIVLDNTALSEVYQGYPFMLKPDSSAAEVAESIKKILLKSKESDIQIEIEKVISKYTVDNFLTSHLTAFYEAIRRKYEK